MSPWDNSGHLNLADPSRQVDGDIQRASWVGNSQGGQSAMVAGISYPDRVRKFVMGGIAYGHRRRPLFDGQSPSEGSRATRQTLDDPSRDNIRRYLRVHIDDESPVTDELVDYIDHWRYDRMVPFEVSIAILNHAADSRLVLLNNCRHWPPFEKPAESAAQVLAFLRGY